jgi:parallel beta-helix repeat protein
MVRALIAKSRGVLLGLLLAFSVALPLGAANNVGPLYPANNLADVNNTLTGLQTLTNGGNLAGVQSGAGNLPTANGGVPTVATRTALAALTTSKNTEAYLSEALRAGPFQWSSSDLSASVTADPGQCVYVPAAADPTGTAGAWVRQYVGALLVDWCGATGDNVTDDNTAIQRAMNLASQIVFGPKTYFVGSQLEYNSGQKISGGGMGLSTIRANGNYNQFYPAGAFGTLVSPNAVALDNVRFSNLTLNAAGVALSQTVMQIVALGTRNLRIENVEFNNPRGDSVYVSDRYGSERTTIIPSDIEITGSRFIGANTNRNGISVITGYNGRIVSNYFYGMTEATQPGPIDLEPDTTAQIIYDWVISNNVIEHSKSGISTDIVGTLVYTSISNIIIANNTIRDPLIISPWTSRQQASIAVYNAENVSITGNTIEDAENLGISTGDSNAITITGNSILNPGVTGLDFADTINLVATGNNVVVTRDTYKGADVWAVYAHTNAATLADNISVQGGVIGPNTVINTVAGPPVQSIGIYLKGQIRNTVVQGTVKGFVAGLFVQSQIGAFPWITLASSNLADNVAAIGGSEGGFTPTNGSWDGGRDVSWGVGSFSASATASISSIYVLPTSVIRVTRVGTTSLANTLTGVSSVKGTIVVTSSAAESGSFLWQVVSP